MSTAAAVTSAASPGVSAASVADAAAAVDMKTRRRPGLPPPLALPRLHRRRKRLSPLLRSG